jgi:hypothetical protein
MVIVNWGNPEGLIPKAEEVEVNDENYNLFTVYIFLK